MDNYSHAIVHKRAFKSKNAYLLKEMLIKTKRVTQIGPSRAIDEERKTPRARLIATENRHAYKSRGGASRGRAGSIPLSAHAIAIGETSYLHATPSRDGEPPSGNFGGDRWMSMTPISNSRYARRRQTRGGTSRNIGRRLSRPRVGREIEHKDDRAD